MKLRHLVREAESELLEGPHPERARLDAEALLLHIFRRIDPSRNRAWLVAHWNNPTDHGQEFRALVERRRRGEPIQYILGEAEFYGLTFDVTPDVLIPRPETEHLVEKAVGLLPLFSRPRIVDVGTGSGAIAIALAHEWPSAAITSIDASPSALELARRNATRNGFADRIRFLQGDLLVPVAGERFEVIVSNPPYVPAGDRDSLAVEVRDHEPALALFAGADGLDVIRRLISESFAVLAPGGWLAMEFGYGQWPAVSALLAEAGFAQIEFVPDLQGIPRVAIGRRA